jgi:hypothetical protein
MSRGEESAILYKGGESMVEKVDVWDDVIRPEFEIRIRIGHVVDPDKYVALLRFMKKNNIPFLIEPPKIPIMVGYEDILINVTKEDLVILSEFCMKKRISVRCFHIPIGLAQGTILPLAFGEADHYITVGTWDGLIEPMDERKRLFWKGWLPMPEVQSRKENKT